MQKILVPFDGSDAAKRAVQFVANSFNASMPVQVNILNIQENPGYLGDYIDQATVRLVEQDLAEKGRKVVLEAAEILQQRAIPHQLHISSGVVAETVVRQADVLGCNSIVMGTRGLGALSGLLLGSVATKVIHLARVPVTLVK